MSVMRSLYSIPVPSLKFVGLPVPKIWLIFDHVVKRPVTVTFNLSGVTGHPYHGFSSIQFVACYALRSRLMIRHRIDRRTDNGHQCIMTTLWGRGIPSHTVSLFSNTRIVKLSLTASLSYW